MTGLLKVIDMLGQTIASLEEELSRLGDERDALRRIIEAASTAADSGDD